MVKRNEPTTFFSNEFPFAEFSSRAFYDSSTANQPKIRIQLKYDQGKLFIMVRYATNLVGTHVFLLSLSRWTRSTNFSPSAVDQRKRTESLLQMLSLSGRIQIFETQRKNYSQFSKSDFQRHGESNETKTWRWTSFFSSPTKWIWQKFKSNFVDRSIDRLGSMIVFVL